MRSALIFAGAAGGLAWSLPALAPVVPSLAHALGVERRLEGADALALTFDDGPGAEATGKVLEVLAGADARATFFLVGEQVELRPSLAREIAAAGHEVALHGHRHRNSLRLTPRQFADDLERGHAAVAEATGVAPELYRPPYGILSAAALAIARRRLSPLLWSRWGRDWRSDATADSVHALVTRDLGAGDVLLLHDADEYGDPGCWRSTVAALPRILETARAAGLRVDSVSGSRAGSRAGRTSGGWRPSPSSADPPTSP
jgi:peptidoglycan/xylan/chitin deacetylase (PgdA/CDA1 family)